MKKIEDIDEKYIDIVKRAQLYRECREYLTIRVGFRELKKDAPEEIKKKYIASLMPFLSGCIFVISRGLPIF